MRQGSRVGGRRGLLAACAGGIALVAFVSACGGEAVPGSEATSRGDLLQVALLTAGPVSDAGWYAGAYEGLLMIEDSLGAQVSHQQTRTPAEFDEAFFAYGSAGYDIVFAHGSEYQDAAVRAGEAFPELTIVVSGGGRITSNVIPLIFTLEDASYLAGMVAGGVTQSGIVGMVGGVAIPSARGTFRAFEAGAKAVNPGVTVFEAFIGSWDDVAAAKEAAVAQLGRGADVLIHNTDAASFGVFQAVREAVQQGRSAWAMGMNRNQNDVAPDVILGSAVIRIPEAFLAVTRRWRSGSLGGAPVYQGMPQNITDLVLNPELAEMVPAPLVEQIEAARVLILEGTLKVPRVPFVEGEVGVGSSGG